MPLTLNSDNSKNAIIEGVLYIVATPIGNLEDITVRAVKILNGVDLIAAEDTRTSGRLLSFYGISTKLTSYHEHNENKKAEELVGLLKLKKSVALISDAGTPAVSDPGFRLVKLAIEHGINVVPIPGASAALTGLCASGLPTDAFVFCGFLPRKKGKRVDVIESLKNEKRTLIFYESPKRILKLIDSLKDILGDRKAVLCRELTKLHEEFLRGTFTDLLNDLSERNSVKGECALVVSGKQDQLVSIDSLTEEICERLKLPDVKPSSLAREMADKYSLRKKTVYEAIQKLTDSSY